MFNMVAGRERGEVSSLRLRTVQSTRRSHRLQLSGRRRVPLTHASGVSALDVEVAEGRYVLSGGADGTIVIHDGLCDEWEQREYETVSSVRRGAHGDAHTAMVTRVQWYPHDSGAFVSSGMDGEVKLWDTNALEVVCAFDLPEHVYSVDMCAGARHQLIATASNDEHVRLCDVVSGTSTHTLRGHSSHVLTVAWSPRDDNVVASGGVDGRVHLWDIRNGRRPLVSLDQHNGLGARVASRDSEPTAHSGVCNSIVYSHDGHFLHTLGSDRRVRSWNASTGTHTLVNYGRQLGTGARFVPMALTRSPCRPSLLALPHGTSVRVYQTETGKLATVLQLHFERVHCVAWNPLRDELLSGGSDRQILVYTPVNDRDAPEGDGDELGDDWSDEN